MAVTQADIEALNAQIAQAERQVTNGDQSVTYRSIADLILARNDLQDQINKASVTTGETPPKPKQTRVYYGGRGYDQ